MGRPRARSGTRASDPGTHAGGEDALRLPEPLRAPRAAAPERRRLDVHGFLAGFVMSLAFGALLYLLLTAG